MSQGAPFSAPVFWFVSLLLLAACCQGSDSQERTPVILVPGNGGSQLWAHLNGAESPWYCRRRSPEGRPQQLWLEMSSLLYPAVNCMAYNLVLKTQPESFLTAASTHDNVGVQTFVPGFGIVDTVLWLSNWQTKYTAYYSSIVAHLEEKLNYTKNIDIKAAPYDFRKAPDELGDYFQSLKTLIEDSFHRASGRKVVLVAHSLGGKLMLHFLHSQPQHWKDQYIGHFVAIGGAFGGVTVSLLAMLSGYNLGIPTINPLQFRTVQRSWPSTHYLLPDAILFGSDRPLVKSKRAPPSPPDAVYTTANLSALFAKASFAKGYAEGRARYGELTDVGKPPGVTTTCVFGDGLPTLASIAWPKVGDKVADADEHENGDGTVAASTARLCRDWSAKQAAPVRVTRLAKAQHVAILSDDRLLELVADVVRKGGKTETDN
ncbi:hypothetical protein BOX15_Mlig020808g2 [Macrostomum lignano]|uniref:Uncharacterized protein n=2 Tax=Macrostomum lignano TaxID=282301 RepID=A0A267H1L7_9PLAT|nr:hypothetical protein BOX15_Mlig020808g2 [Macrostomum lignano]